MLFMSFMIFMSFLWGFTRREWGPKSCYPVRRLATVTRSMGVCSSSPMTVPG